MVLLENLSMYDTHNSIDPAHPHHGIRLVVLMLWLVWWKMCYIVRGLFFSFSFFEFFDLFNTKPTILYFMESFYGTTYIC